MNKNLPLLILIILIIPSTLPTAISTTKNTNLQQITMEKNQRTPEKRAYILCETYGLPTNHKHTNIINKKDTQHLLNMIHQLQLEIQKEPGSTKVNQIQQNIFTYAYNKKFIPTHLSNTQLQKPIQKNHIINKLPLPHTGVEFFCNYASTGEGSALPVIILPRLIPVLLTPIPRAIFMWDTYQGITSCGGLTSHTGFIASGTQKGLALGFWGIGFSIFLPPIMAYGIIGYALFCKVDCLNISYWPPNYPPSITPINPLNNAVNIPITTKELEFYITDRNKDFMNFTVTTIPYVGGGTKNNVTDGSYRIPIKNLEGSETYTWTIQLTDGKTIVDETYSFSTEPVAPFVTNPNPKNKAIEVSVNLTHLQFHLHDLQGDLMNYTVETVPNIGSGSGNRVSDGTYFIPIQNIDYMTEYIWYINVTDGTYTKLKKYCFSTEPEIIFNPFEKGWQYRKKITINHHHVDGNLTNFPILINHTDIDLQSKAQSDGDDFLFMNAPDTAHRLYHEIESYDCTTGSLIAWVNSSYLPKEHNTSMYVYYGNPTSMDQQIIDKTWDSHYVGIWHLDQNNNAVNDSTAYNNSGQNCGATPTNEGKIGPALDFEYDDPDKVEIDHSKSLDITDEITVECWVKPESFNYNRMTLCTKRQCYYTNIFHTGQLTIYTYWNNNGKRGQSDYMASNNTLKLHEWNHCAWTETTTGERSIFLEGIIDKIKTFEASIWSEPSEALHFGWNKASPIRKLDGILDEVRISNIAREPAWITTGYTNQKTPGEFYTVGYEFEKP